MKFRIEKLSNRNELCNYILYEICRIQYELKGGKIRKYLPEFLDFYLKICSTIIIFIITFFTYIYHYYLIIYYTQYIIHVYNGTFTTKQFCAFTIPRSPYRYYIFISFHIYLITLISISFIYSQKFKLCRIVLYLLLLIIYLG